MTVLLTGTQAVRTSGALVLVGPVLSGPVAMLVFTQVSPPPAWIGVISFADTYHSVQVLPYVLGYILLAGFVLFSASCHSLAAEPVSFAWIMEMFGYAAMGVAAWLLAPALGGSRRSDVICYLLIANGVLGILRAVRTALPYCWVFSASGLMWFAGSKSLIAVCPLLIAVTTDSRWGWLTGLVPVAATR